MANVYARPCQSTLLQPPRQDNGICSDATPLMSLSQRADEASSQSDIPTQLDQNSQAQISAGNSTASRRWTHPKLPRPISKALQAWDSRLRRSRFHGWRMGVLFGCCMSFLVLCCNIALIAIGANSKFGYDHEGISSILEGDETRIARWDSALHVLINVLSTALLSSSNYTMQVLSSPTRKDVDVAHAKGQWLDIGRLSPRNLRAISRSRATLWLILVLSSTPLHLLYVVR